MSVEQLFKYLPYRFAKGAAHIPDDLLCQAFEIRLRLKGASSISVKNKNVSFKENGVSGVENAMKATKEDMDKCLTLLCSGSVYAYEHTLRNGYVPLPCGRAGVCGDAVTDENGNVLSFREIYSISLRIHKPVNDFASELISYYRQNGLCGTIIYAPPMKGKTTLLRSACFLLSNGFGIRPYRVGIVDERREITAGASISGLSDVISDCPKAKAIEMLTRTMAPEVIACDELTEKEAPAVAEAQNTGVILIATAHAADQEMLLKRQFIKNMIEKNIFGIAVKIKSSFDYDIEKTG